MRARFPIYAKILVWFFVNLAVLVCAGWLVVRGQFRFSTFTSGAALDRVERATSRIAEDLSAAPRSEWDVVIETHERTWGVEFYCYDDLGRMIAGRTAPLPPEVHSRLIGPRRGQLDRGDRLRPIRLGEDGNLRVPRRDGLPFDDEFRPPDDQRPPRPRLNRPPREEGPPEAREPDDERPLREDAGVSPPENRRPPVRGLNGPPAQGRPLDDRPRRMVPDLLRDDGRVLIQTHDPARYWVLVRHQLTEDGKSIPGAIIASSDSPTGRGLYFDSKPFIWAGLGVLVLSGLIWFPFVRSLTRSVGRLRDATGDLAKGKFDVRVNETRRDEVGELGGEINRMAERLAGYVHGQKRFLGDVAHELCAPIARLQTAVSILEQRASEADKVRLADVSEEVEHMAGLVNELLQFSRASIGGMQAELREVSIREVAERAIHREAGDTSNVTLALEGDLSVRAEPDLLQRALGNLLRNAIRYAGDAGPITVSAIRDGDSVRIGVADSGPGIPPESLPKIFDPLYRVDTARTHGGGGIGLGLAIVKTCVDACGGTVTASNREQGGLVVTMTLAAG